jgi:hypothetical protein
MKNESATPKFEFFDGGRELFPSEKVRFVATGLAMTVGNALGDAVFNPDDMGLETTAPRGFAQAAALLGVEYLINKVRGQD